MMKMHRWGLLRKSVRSRNLAILASALGAACGGGETAPTPQDNMITLSAQQVWAGSDFTIHADRIAQSAEVPVVLLDTLVMPTTIVDGATLGVSLPPGFLGGAYPVTLRFRDTVITGPTLSVAGFTGVRSGEYMNWNTYVTPVSEPGVPEVIFASDTIIRVLDATDLSFRDYSQFRISNVAFGGGVVRNLGMSWIPGAYALPDSSLATRWGLYRLDGPATLVQEITCSSVKFGCISLSPAVFLSMQSHNVDVYGVDDPALHFIVTSDPGPGAFSPKGDRMTYQAALSNMDGTEGGHPVFAVPSGHLAYLVPIKCPGIVTFSPDGALLGIGTCHWSGTPPAVYLYDAESGEPAGSIPLEHWPLSIAFDPTAPRLYVAMTDSVSDSLTVRVYDSSTLELQGRLDAPLTVPAGLASAGTALVFSDEPALYLVTMTSYDKPVTSVRFSLPEH